MLRSFAAKTLFSLVMLLVGGAAIWAVFHLRLLPFTLEVIDARTAVVHRNPGFELPAGIQAGDEVDLTALDPETRNAIVVYDMQGTVTSDHTYRFVIRHGAGTADIPVSTLPASQSRRAVVASWFFSVNVLIFIFLGLLTVWRGHDKAAGLLAAWLVMTLIGFGFNYGFGWDGAAGVSVMLLALVCYTLTRITFYLTIEALLGPALGPRARRLWRTGLALTLALGLSSLAGGHLLYVLNAWAGLMLPAVGILFSAGYLVSVGLMLYGYGRATEAQKPQLRWLLLSTCSFLVSVFVSNSPFLDLVTSQVVQSVAIMFGISGMVYTVLRHRVVDVRVIIDHTLVYGATTALVVGVVAALNSLALRATLGENTGLLLQIIIPLALGIVLGKVRSFMDRAVEQVFFRRKYLAEKSLRTFARQAGQMENPAKLMEAAAREIQRQLRAPAVGLYSAGKDGYRLLQQTGGSFPAELDLDDAAIVALRTDREATEIPEVGSALEGDGCLFPMMVLGNLRGAVVCRNRPGEHYAPDERQLLTQVAGDVGAALRILRARDNETIVAELLTGKVSAQKLRQKARALATA